MVLRYFRIWWMSVSLTIVTSWEVFGFMCVDTLWMSLDSDNCLPYQQSMWCAFHGICVPTNPYISSVLVIWHWTLDLAFVPTGNHNKRGGVDYFYIFCLGSCLFHPFCGGSCLFPLLSVGGSCLFLPFLWESCLFPPVLWAGVTVLKVFGLCTTVPALHSMSKISWPQALDSLANQQIFIA